MNTQQLDERIEKLESERTQLTTAHDQTMAQLQQVLTNNRNRFQQLSGAIDILKELKTQFNGKEPQ